MQERGLATGCAAAVPSGAATGSACTA